MFFWLLWNAVRLAGHWVVRLIIGLGIDTLCLGVRVIGSSSKLFGIAIPKLSNVFAAESAIFVSRCRSCWVLNIFWLNIACWLDAHKLFSGLLREFSFVLQLLWVVDECAQLVNFVSKFKSLFNSVRLLKFKIWECPYFEQIVFNVLDHSRSSVLYEVVHHMDSFRDSSPLLWLALELLP